MCIRDSGKLVLERADGARLRAAAGSLELDEDGLGT